MNEKKELMIYAAAAGLVFLFCALLPLSFAGRGNGSEDELNLAVRCGIFARYWNSEDAGAKAEKIEDPGGAAEQFCADRMDELTALCSVDTADKTVDTAGTEYLKITSEDGTINLCRMWLQNQGDWRCWMDVCFDMDTGDVYYLYTSSECITNADSYLKSMPKELNTQQVAEKIAETLGYRIYRLDESSKTGAPAQLVLTQNGNALFLEVSCTYYRGTLLDIKIQCV